MTNDERNPKFEYRMSKRRAAGTDYFRHSSFGIHSSLVIRYSSFLLLSAPFLLGAAIDETNLPPPTALKVEFTRDVKPIFEAACLRCHGPERPKSRFRLDNRESALKGGENGIDIIPGNSAKSPLIHYVARLVPDLEMPPEGKGRPLTSEQVGLLRAWIDQGAMWGETNPPAQYSFTATPMAGWIGVHGDTHKFREIEGVQEGARGGIEHFDLQEQVGLDTKFSAEGRALFPDNDFQIKLALQKADVGFVRAGFEQWRRYYDDTGGYYRPFVPPSFNLNQDLHLDIGRAWIDFGLTRPSLPQIVIGYEYQFQEGAKSMLEWGDVNGKNIYPAAKDIHEHVHIAKLDLTHDFSGWHVEDNARVELYKQSTFQQDDLNYTLGPGPNVLANTSEGASHIQGMNTLRVERQVASWCLLSAGYLYSQFNGNDSFNQTTVDSAGVPTQGQFWSSDAIVLKRESQVFSATGLLQPLDGLSASLGLQTEWQRQEGSGNINLDSGDPNVPETFVLVPTTVQSDLDTSRYLENVGLRYTKIPFTVLFADAEFKQEDIGQYENEDAGAIGGVNSFLRDTDSDNHTRQEQFGFNTSPWRWFTWSAHFRNRRSDTDYNNRVDLSGQPGSTALGPNPGYSAFIRHRDIDTDEVETKLVIRPANWLRAALTYQKVNTDYWTTTDPVPTDTISTTLLDGKYRANVYGLGLTLTPIQRFYFSGTFNYSDSSTVTAPQGTTAVVPYEGNGYSVMASANYALNATTRLHCAYAFSHADYAQNNYSGLPLGLSFTRNALVVGVSRQLTSNLTTSLRYGYYSYSEPSTGNLNNYTANGVFGTLVVKWR